MKKLTSILLALLMALTLLPTAVFAETTATALPTAENGVYTLTQDVTLSETLVIDNGETWTINLNGHTLSASKKVIMVRHGKLIVNGTGTIKETNPDHGAIVVTGSFNDPAAKDYSVVEVNEGVNLEAWAPIFVGYAGDGDNIGKSYGVSISVTGATLNFCNDQGGFSGTGVYLNGAISHKANAPVIKLVNTTIKPVGNNTGHGLYLAGYPDTTLTNCSVTGQTGVEIRSGKLAINGGTFVANATTFSCTPNGDGSTTIGAALAIAQHTTKKNITVTIDGGTFTGIKALNESNPQENDPAPQVDFTVKSGTFNGDVSITDANDSKITGGTFNDPCALKYAKSGANVTIKLDKDMTENVVVPTGVTATLDLDDKTLTNTSDHTITVEKGATLTINGTGTVDNKSHAKAALYNMGTVTLNGGKYTRSEENGNSKTDAGGNSFYNIVNYGTMTINDGVTVEQRGGYSSMVVNGYQNQKQTKYAATPTMTIAGGTFKGGLNTIKNDDNGNLTITGGTFENYKQACVQNHHVATISGGTYTSTNKEASAVLNCGIKGCDAVDADKHELTISGGTFDGALVKTAGKLAITGGTFSTNPAEYVNGTEYVVTKVADSKYTVGASTGTSSVVLPSSGSESSTSTSTSASIPASDIDANKELVIKNDTATTSVTFNSAAAESIKNKTGENDTATLEVKTSEAKKNTDVDATNKAAYNEAISGKDTSTAVVVEINFKNQDGTSVFADGVADGYAIVTVQYMPNLKNVNVHYLNGSVATPLTQDANLSTTDTYKYDSETGVITMKLAHFSQYLITTDKTSHRGPIHTGYGGGATTTTTTGKAQSPTTFDAGIAIYGVMAVSSVLGMGYMGKKKFF